MLFQSKKKKIKDYLACKRGSLTTFDDLLLEYMNGKLKERLSNIGIANVSLYVDFDKNIRCIDIDGKYKQYFLEIQIDEEEFFIDYDEDEPDNPNYYPLETKERFYIIVEDTLLKLK